MFTKGQLVTLLQNWDRQGTVRVVDLIVHSCGKKRMILVDDAGAQFEGRFFSPAKEQPGCGYVVSRLSKADADAAALGFGAVIVKDERARMEHAIAHYGYPETDGYTKSVRKSLAELHEPRVYRVG